MDQSAFNNVDKAAVCRELKRLEALRDDLLLLSVGRGPSLTNHPDALVLTNWLHSSRFVDTLVGFRSDESDGEKIHMTSQIVCIDEAAGWARSTSRWYRLGDRMDD